MRRGIRNDENRIARLEANRNINRAPVASVDAPDQRERKIRPLIFLDAAVILRFKKGEAPRRINRAPLQLDMWAVLMSADDAQSIHDGIGADHGENQAAVAIRNNQARAGLHL